ncbi:MAG TPA: DeoR family transcriptional regulator [Candidatus Dojkabacteria bacterium]|nr:DeoR family transcriptional regulator [Candidatus Dojkabacteria bacterium]
MEDSNKKEIPIISHLLTILSVLIGIFILFSIFKNKKEGDSKPKLKEKPQTSNSNGIVQDSVKKVVGLNKRQEEILSEVRKLGEISPSELYKLQPNVSPRTLRRDMDVLANKGLVNQEGSTKSTKYTYLG